MSISIESGSLNSLYCELCDYVQFSSYTEFHVHHLIHIRQPLVRLVKLNSNLCEKLKTKSYKVNTGVARRSVQLEQVPPLKISLVKQQGTKQFQVIKRQKSSSGNNSPNLEVRYPDFDSQNNWKEETKTEVPLVSYSGVSEVEGKNLLERFGAKISVTRKRKPDSPGPPGNGKKDADNPFPTTEIKKEDILERLSGIGGISISTKSKSSTNGNLESKPQSGISVSSNKKSINLNELKNFKDHENEYDKKVFDKNKILEKLSGSGLISIAPKGQQPKEDKESSDKEGKKKEEAEQQGYLRGESQEFIDRLGGGLTVRSKIEINNDSSDSKGSSDDQTCQINIREEGSGNGINENSSESSEKKKFVRVKNTTFKKKKIRPERQSSQEESPEEQSGTPEEPKEKEGSEGRESGIDILERLTDNLNNSVGVAKSGTNLFSSEEKNIGEPEKMEEPLLSNSSGGGKLSPILKASQSDCVNTVTPDSQFHLNSEGNPQEQECPLLLTPPSSSGQEGVSSDFSTISSHPSDSYGEPNTLSEDNSEITENTVAFTSLASEDHSQEARDQPSSFWTDIRDASNSVDQPQQDPLMTPDNPVSNGDGINQNFLHNFLNEPQQPPNSMPPENSEFMSLDRLAQTQHQPHQPYDLNSGEANTPMEQLSQQVQRIPNPTPQINVIPQHHMQAPQPPPLHTGVPLSPQHISPQQPNSYDALSHMQPPMPPPLYQGLNMFNQNYPPQTPQQMPRPPMLQQRPHIQPRSFQSLAAPQRPRSRPFKRNSVRLPSQDMGPPKQRRLDHPLQVRPQPQNPATKLPSGITVTPPKKAVEANKVANVLASRGITVTPAASRQPITQAPRPQQRNTTPSQSPILNISPAISITSSSQNRNNGGFAVPGPRRSNVPIVNHNIERPERCTTVDLTQDDEIVQMPRGRSMGGRYPCNQCNKIFTSATNLENHKASHRAAANVLPFKCDKCTAHYSSSAHLQHHKLTVHKTKQSAPDLAIPIVDLNHPGAREQLLKCGVYNFIPLAQLQSNNNGYFGVPIIQLDTAKEKAVSNLSLLGAGNILVLGKMKALAPQPNH